MSAKIIMQLKLQHVYTYVFLTNLGISLHRGNALLLIGSNHTTLPACLTTRLVNSGQGAMPGLFTSFYKRH